MKPQPCNLYTAARALDTLNRQVETLKTDLAKLTTEVARIEDCCQQISEYINAVYLNCELYSEVFKRQEESE